MSSHLTDYELKAYERLHLPADRLIAADKHLADCQLCSSRLNPDERLEELARAVQERFAAVRRGSLRCPHFNEISAFIANELTGEARQRIEEHLDFCGVCDDLVQDLPDIEGNTNLANPIARAERSLWSKARDVVGDWRLWVSLATTVSAIMLVIILALTLSIRKHVVEIGNRINQIRDEIEVTRTNLQNRITSVPRQARTGRNQ